MKILIVGGGGREHAIGLKIHSQHPEHELYFMPGNAGTSDIGTNIDINASDIDKIVKKALEIKFDFVIIGPEDPLCLGLADKLENNGVKTFGVLKDAARLEGSKAYAKEFMVKHGIPTAAYKKFKSETEAVEFAKKLRSENSQGKVVLKADGLCAGKGVVIACDDNTIETYATEIYDNKKFGDTFLVVEEFLDGFEISLLCFTDGKTILPMPTAKDHKKVYDGETGLNTGGMGTYSPNVQGDVYLKEMHEKITEPFLKGLQEEKIDFRGIIFFGLMVCDSGIKALEFNARFGDPETQSILMRMESDLLDVFEKTALGELSSVNLKFNDKKVITAVMCSAGYPESYVKGKKITGLDNLNSTVFHAGTKKQGSDIVTSGGRVLALSYAADTFEEAYDKVYSDLKKVRFDGAFYRKDISPLVKRVYAAKKDSYDIASFPMKIDINESLHINLKSLKIYQRYDIQGLTDEELKKISVGILSEAPLDDVYVMEDALKLQKTFKHPIVVQFQKGQFNQREQGVIDTVAVALEKTVAVKSDTVIDFEGDISTDDINKIKKYLINPVDQKEGRLLGIPTTLKETFDFHVEKEEYDGFISMNEDEKAEFFKSQNFAMSREDFDLIFDYFKNENRNPTATELAVLDTYWSDHCRHTTFNTILDEIYFDTIETALDSTIKNTFRDYMRMRKDLKSDKPVTLMDLGTIMSKYMKSHGMLDMVEESDEINACSIKADVKIDDKIEKYLIMFKNETHNHPTEIEPFGGAATCLGGAVRDPLSGRAYVYQAMRVTGSADPTEPIENTMDGKLPQRKITSEAAHGYSSYGNQLGLATGYVDEVYHPGYKAKRMEVGAVIGAAPAENVRRENLQAGDIILLIGGRTGRDGIGGATGSSKSQNENSITESSAEVQKGNAPTERKIQRLFRNPDAAKLIKKCNDFGAGGVSVAIGELAPSLEIHLDKVPLKYLGLTAREIAISESQERMAVGISSSDKEKFCKLCHDENLEVTQVAEVTDTGRLIMKYGDMIVADLLRSFVDSAGYQRHQKVKVKNSKKMKFLYKPRQYATLHGETKSIFSEILYCNREALVTRFDSSVGRGTVIAPLGGKYQKTKAQSMVSRVPSLKGTSSTVSVMTYGLAPYLSEADEFLGGDYAVIESLCKLAASGANPFKAVLSFQEYFQKLGNDENKWGSPFKSLLGAYKACKEMMVAPIGGKDSMSGTFENIHVPPTLISFAVSMADEEDIISPEFKGDRKIGLILTYRNEDSTLDIGAFKYNLEALHREIKKHNITACKAVTARGILPILVEMSEGNRVGIDAELEKNRQFDDWTGSFIVEYDEHFAEVQNIGKTYKNKELWKINGEVLDFEEIIHAGKSTLSKVFTPEILFDDSVKLDGVKQTVTAWRKSKKPVDKVKVIIPAFPGTNSEYDSADAFRREGADVEIVVFNNLTSHDISVSIEKLADKISHAQILFIPGGFSMGDEPDGSGKFIANVLKNPKISNALNNLLNENDGLILGICNGFQALIKTGLLPYGKITEQDANSPTLTYNNSGRHIARLADTRIIFNKSPWFSKVNPDTIYRMPISHGEGRFICDEQNLKSLIENGQIATAYIDNPNGSAANIEGITDPSGKILGKMGHSERVDEGLYKNVPDIIKQDIFKSGVAFFKK